MDVFQAWAQAKFCRRFWTWNQMANSQEEQYGKDFNNNQHSLIHKDYDKIILISCIVPATTVCM